MILYLRRCGMEFDIAVNVLFGGALGETVSERAAFGAGWRPSINPDVAQRTGARTAGWCVLCWLLSRLVQRRHCAVQFTSAPTPGIDVLRASVAFGVLFLVVWLAVRAVV